MLSHTEFWRVVFLLKITAPPQELGTQGLSCGHWWLVTTSESHQCIWNAAFQSCGLGEPSAVSPLLLGDDE